MHAHLVSLNCRYIYFSGGNKFSAKYIEFMSGFHLHMCDAIIEIFPRFWQI